MHLVAAHRGDLEDDLAVVEQQQRARLHVARQLLVVQPDMLAIIEQHKRQLKVNNVITVQGTETDPRLPAQAVDVALLVDAYHEFAYPREMMEHIVKSLKPGGRVIQIEYRGEDASVPIKSLHKMTVAQARKEMEAVGLRWQETRDFLPYQHFIVFTKP